MEKEKPFRLDVVSIRLVKDAPLFSDRPINTPEDAAALLGSCLCEMDREVICVVNLNADNVPINCNFASVGTVNRALMCPRELFKTSILSNAAKIMLVHNHPGGNLKPSRDDVMTTDLMAKLCSMMGIPLIDHVIVGRDNREIFSFFGKGILPQPDIKLETDYHMIDFGQRAVAEQGKAR